MKGTSFLGIIMMYCCASLHAGNGYEKILTLPVYNNANSEMYLIQSDTDWNHINDTDKRYFFVAPGNYTGLGRIDITISGSAASPRWLLWYDPSDPEDISTHPVDMSIEKRAEFERIRLRGSHWIIDRIYGTATAGSKNPTFELEASNLVINRVLVEDGGGGAGQISIQASEIIVQNSVLRNTQIIPNNDIHAMKLSFGYDVRIVNNEIYNFAGDGLQLGDKPESFKGAVIYNNDFYIDVSLYPEEVEEIPHENAIDIKQAGLPGNAQNLVLIKNNRFRNIAHTPGGTSPNIDQGTIDFSNKNDSKSHVLVEDNIFYDCKIPFNTKGGGQTSNFTIRRNLIYNATRFGFWVPGDYSGHEFSYNTILGVSDFQGDQNWINTDSENQEIYGNLIVDGGVPLLEEGNYVSDYNVFANSIQTTSEGANSVILTAIEGNEFVDFCYTFKQLTNPIMLCIPNAQPLQSTGFTYLTSGKYFGTAQDVGIDDRIYNQDWVGALYPAKSTNFPTLAFQSPTLLDTISGAVDLVLTVTDENEDLTGVQLFIDGQNLGDLLTSEPFNYNWNSTSTDDGLHILKAFATNGAGNITYSRPVQVFVDNIPDSAPTVTLDNLQNGSEVANILTLSASASDVDGDLIGVQFILSGGNLGDEKFAQPYQYDWHTTTVTDGEYEVWVVARDHGGRVVQTSPISITVNNSYPPLVSITSVKSDSVVNDRVELIADASDKDDDIISVDFLVDDVSIGKDSDAPYSQIWNTRGQINGEHKLVAVAEDSDGNIVPSRAIFVQVSNIILTIPEQIRKETLYPNPASDYILVEGVDVGTKYDILTLNGAKIAQGILKQDQHIDVSGILDGLYVVSFDINNKDRLLLKLIKSKID